MSPLDLLITVGVVSAIVGGYRLGFLARLTSWAGLGLGLTLGAIFLPDVARYFADAEQGVRALAAIAFLLAAGMLGQGIGLALGAALHASLRIGPGLRQYDRIFGGVTGAIGILAIFWLLAPSFAHVEGTASRWTRDSIVLRAMDGILPPPPASIEELRRLLADTAFPTVFDNRDRSPETPPPPVESGISPEISQRVVNSTMKIAGQACRKIQEGSGFVAAPEIVVTNAHVVAGEQATEVETHDGRSLSASVVVFDPNRDLAVLRVPGLGLEPLPIAAADEGAVGAVYGHPGGGDLEISPALVSDRVTAVGRDIYDQNRTRRDVFILASELRPGDSGGAFVNQNGEVVGVAFAIAPDRNNTAYALTDAELRPTLEQAGADPVETGPCLV